MARPANPELRNDILTAATRIIEDCGPDCVTMRDVAKAVGYTPTTLYLYFKDKHAILREVVVRGFEELADFLRNAAVGPTPVDRLRQRGRAYIVWGVMHPGLYQLMFEARIDADMAFEPEESARLMSALAESATVIDDAIAAGQLKGVDDAIALGNATWAAVHGVTSLSISRRLAREARTMTPAQLLRTATDIGDMLVNASIQPYLA